MNDDFLSYFFHNLLICSLLFYKSFQQDNLEISLDATIWDKILIECHIVNKIFVYPMPTHSLHALLREANEFFSKEIASK